jgi:hypothetical protein
MSKATISVELPDPLMHDATLRAEKAGVSVSTWIRDMVADRVRDEAVTERFFLRRQRAGDAKELLAILDMAPDVPPIPGDELEG